MFRKFALILLGGILLFLGLLHANYGLGYIARVYVKQEADADDFKWKPAIILDKAENALQIPRNLAVENIKSAFEADPLIADIDRFFSESGTTALIVIKDGKVALEKHYNGHKPGDIVGSFSVSKSFFSIVLAGAIARGEIISLDDPITDFIPELLHLNSRFSDITIADLIDMRSGIGFDSNVNFPFFNKDKTLVYYATDLRKNLVKHPRIETTPGNFLYNDFNPNLIALALERASDQSIEELLSDNLWTSLGAEYDAIWSTDYRGFPLVESGLAAAPIDLAKLGLAMLETERSGNGIISESWYRRSTRPKTPQSNSTFDGRNWSYQNGWWIVPRQESPTDFSAIGNFGQYVYISPSNRVVIVRTGIERGDLQDADFTSLFYRVAERISQ